MLLNVLPDFKFFIVFLKVIIIMVKSFWNTNVKFKTLASTFQKRVKLYDSCGPSEKHPKPSQKTYSAVSVG